MKAILTVIGKDQVGIVYEVSKILSRTKVNILDINQTIMQDYFTMVLLCDFEGADKNLDELQKEFLKLEKKQNLVIKLQNEEIFNAVYNI